MALVPHKITALAESDAQGTNGKNIVAGAVVSLYDTDGSAVTLFDSESGANGSTAKQTDSTGQVVVWVTAGEYDEEVNGSIKRRVNVGGNSVVSYETTESLQSSRPNKTGQRAENRERANAQYVLAASGYTALSGDITAANGRVWALQKNGNKWLAENFSSLSEALSRAATGETVVFFNSLVASGDLIIPKGVTLKGGYESPGEVRDSWDYTSLPSTIRLDNISTILLGENACIKNCVIINDNLSAPYSSEVEALAGIAAFAGTAITVSGADVNMENLLILGFGTAVYSRNHERITCDRVKGDCTNGIDIGICYDIAYITRCHFWPFITVHQIGSGLPISTYTRSGSAYKFSDVADWCKITDSFSYGYSVGVTVTNANNVQLIGVGCDNITIADTEETRGFLISGTSRDTKLIGCQTANQEHGYVISTSAGLHTSIESCDAWVTETSGVLVSGGDVSINGGRIRNGASGVLVNNGQSTVTINGVAFDTMSGRPINAAMENKNLNIGVNDYGDLTNGITPVSPLFTTRGIPSADPLALPPNGSSFTVTGITGFGSINGGFEGRTVTLTFDGSLTVTGGAFINMQSNFTTSNGSILNLVFLGGKWNEVSRI